MLTASIAPFLAGLALTLAIEALLRPPVTPFWRRAPSTLAVHLGSWCLLYALFLLVLQRPWFAVVFIASLQLVVVQSSNVKSATLKEPFICQDFEYFLDALKHPRLYVPFFGIGLAIAASSAGALAIALFVWLEPSLTTRSGPAAALLLPAALLSTAAALLLPGLRRLPPCTLAPHQDLHRLGLFAALWSYGRLALIPIPAQARHTPFASALHASSPTSSPLPHLVVVQSEAFFDPRGWLSELPNDLLPNFDALRSDALRHGPLRVPAWGANTVRTEAAFLTGLSPDSLGIHRFTPYRQLVRAPITSLATRLRQLGYRTVCLHPYPASFYMRHRAMPHLGFDDFLDARHFTQRDRDGQYISDRAVAEKVGRLLDAGDNRPLFIFVITMENHGPLHLERPVPQDAPALPPRIAQRLSPAAAADLQIYLRHLYNADRMLGQLRAALTPVRSGARHGMLCWYGDHVPIMSDAYRQLGEPDGDTCYAIWASHAQRVAGAEASAPLAAHELGQATLQALLRTTGYQSTHLSGTPPGDTADDDTNNDAAGQIQSHQEQ